MEETIEFLTRNTSQFLATIGLDGKPKVRPFQLMMQEGEKLYFCTSNRKAVFGELRNNPQAQLCAAAPDFSWIRVSGKAVFVEETALKERVLNSHPLVKSIYLTADNPIFEVFYFEGGEAVISDFSGNPPRRFAL